MKKRNQTESRKIYILTTVELGSVPGGVGKKRDEVPQDTIERSLSWVVQSDGGAP